MSSLGLALCRSVGALVLVAIATLWIVACNRVAPPTRAAPIRAAVYYPWFPQAWNQQGQNPFTSYRPSRGSYSTDVATVRAQIADMQYGRISVGIASWFGPGTTTDSHWPRP
jgi:hypothetical protein